MQANVNRPNSLNLEDYIILSPGEVPGKEVEYCIQDQSRPKLFDLWRYVVPVGRAVTSLVSSLIDNNTGNSQSISSRSCSLSFELVSPEVCKNDGNESVEASVLDDSQLSTQESKLDPSIIKAAVPTKFGGYANAKQRRQSLRKSNAVSSFGESDTNYMLHRLKVTSRENSLEDYLMLTVKSKQIGSTESLISSPTQEKVSMKGHFDTIEKDGPVHLVKKSSLDHPINTASPSCTRRMENVEFILKRPSGFMKSNSEPSKTDIVSSNSLTKIHLERPTSFPPAAYDVTCPVGVNKERVPPESEIQSIVKKHGEMFVKYSNWDMLLPHLETEDLLDPQARETLANPLKTHHEKSIYFYFEVLPSKGRSAYTSFYKCIIKETKHKGHQTLQEYFKQTQT